MEEQLLHCSKGRGIDLQSYVKALCDAVTEVEQSILDFVSPFLDDPNSKSNCDRQEARKQLAPRENLDKVGQAYLS